MEEEIYAFLWVAKIIMEEEILFFVSRGNCYKGKEGEGEGGKGEGDEGEGGGRGKCWHIKR